MGTQFHLEDQGTVGGWFVSTGVVQWDWCSWKKHQQNRSKSLELKISAEILHPLQYLVPLWGSSEFHSSVWLLAWQKSHNCGPWLPAPPPGNTSLPEPGYRSHRSYCTEGQKRTGPFFLTYYWWSHIQFKYSWTWSCYGRALTDRQVVYLRPGCGKPFGAGSLEAGGTGLWFGALATAAVWKLFEHATIQPSTYYLTLTHTTPTRSITLTHANTQKKHYSLQKTGASQVNYIYKIKNQMREKNGNAL